ncbi:BTAD domain-containing putative transcriptional regulator [Streptomyces sp. NPDC058961]|uniref:AfsR/SARP family transcriptional regulator n=1 Tax=Streptomyces sp. NPDC058961 TaxID=3346680 RepID=UPI0036B3B0B3
MDFHLLGPVEARRAGEPIALSGTKAHTLLAALLLARGRVVPDSRLSRLLWGTAPPATMSAQIYTYVSRLRKLLEPEATLERRPPGYALRTGDGLVDIVEYERLDRLGRQALHEHRYEDAGNMLRDALALWQGPLLGNVTEFLAEEEIPQWEEGRAATLENRMEAELALGRHARIVAELTRLVSDFPLRERMRAQLMTALYRCGRRADALHVFHEGRTALAEQLGVDPGVDLTRTHQAALRGTLDLALDVDVDLDVSPVLVVGPGLVVGPVLDVGPGLDLGANPEPVERGTADPAAVHTAEPEPLAPRPHAGLPVLRAPAMLPPATAGFTGRGRELAALRRLLTPDGRATPRRCLITGMAGIGKTALAVHAAYQNRAHFPDGQLYADLTEPDGTAKDPRDVLAHLLRALGEQPSGPAPYDLDDLVRAYRTSTAGRRILVLLDNATDGRRLAPLLPSGAQSAVLVTGHTPLAVTVGAATLGVVPLSPQESLDLLAATAGRARTEAERGAARTIAEHCGGLPLALRLAGARLAARSHWSLARLAGRLAETDTRLDELAFGELELRDSLAKWLARTDEGNRCLLARLSALGARSFSAASAAAVLGLPDRLAEDLVERLADSALLEIVHPSGGAEAAEKGRAAFPHRSHPRYRFHPLVLLYVQSLPVERPVPVTLVQAG